jgi:hypothetical protein
MRAGRAMKPDCAIRPGGARRGGHARAGVGVRRVAVARWPAVRAGMAGPTAGAWR